MAEELSRRDVLSRAGIAAASGFAGPIINRLPSIEPTRQSKSPNDKIVFGLIGCGGMGASNMRNFMGHDDVEVAALCDVDDHRITNDYQDVEKKYGRKPEIFKDYRKMLERKDIDAIIVGTPDHWHALNLIHTMEAGKDAYCEKPISHDITEALSMAGAKAHYNRVVQVGTWQRSTKEFTDAIAYIRAGKLGKITHCRAWISDGTRIGKGKVTAPPTNLNFPMWVGPATMFPYQENKVHWNWRWVMNTGGGLTTDWGVHMMDIALLGMSHDEDLVMPTEVSAYGGNWALQDDDRDAPDVIESVMRFRNPDFVMTWSVLRDHPGKPGHGTEFVSADGRTLRVWRGGWTIVDGDGKELPKEESPAVDDHWRNFLDCVKSRKQPHADLRSVAQTTITCQLVNASLYSGQQVKWDKNKMDIIGNAGKKTLAYEREYRAPWSLPKYKWQ